LEDAAMALINPVSSSLVGVAVTATAVSASDTIAQTSLGANGALLLVLNGGGSPDVVAISDAGKTDAGNAGTSSGGSVTNATNKLFYISPRAVDPTTSLVTVTHTFITSVTCYLIPLG
jgi:hypothetical protein